MTQLTESSDKRGSNTIMTGNITPSGHSLDQWFALAADRRCRGILAILQQLPDETVTLVELIHHLSNATDEPVDVTSERDRMRLRSELHHSLLPKLAAAEIIVYVDEERTVRYSPPEKFELLLSRLPVDLQSRTSRNSPSTVDMNAHTKVLIGLANSRRRFILRQLRTNESMTLSVLADDIAVHEHDQSLADIAAKTVRQTYISLYHTHIPTLESATLVQYDQAVEKVSLTEQAKAVERYDDFLP